MLELETRTQKDLTPQIGMAAFTPPISESYWAYRVKLSNRQSVIGFPKFGTIGIGFAVEDEDWNTNLPYWCSVEEIFNHISHNKGSDEIPDSDCREAIRMIIRAAVRDRGHSANSRPQAELGPEYRAAMGEFHADQRTQEQGS